MEMKAGAVLFEIDRGATGANDGVFQEQQFTQVNIRMKQTAMKNQSSNNIGVFDLSYDTGEQYWSSHFRVMLRVPLDVPAEHHLFLQRLNPGDRRSFESIATRTWQPGYAQCATHEGRIPNRDGTSRLLRIEVCTSFRASGERDAVRTVDFAFDVTERSDQLRSPLTLAALVNDASRMNGGLGQVPGDLSYAV